MNWMWECVECGHKTERVPPTIPDEEHLRMVNGALIACTGVEWRHVEKSQGLKKEK